MVYRALFKELGLFWFDWCQRPSRWYAHICVCERVRESEFVRVSVRQCECVCICERESVFVCVCVRLCVCVCVRVRESEFVRVSVRLCECVCVYV